MTGAVILLELRFHLRQDESIDETARSLILERPSRWIRLCWQNNVLNLAPACCVSMATLHLEIYGVGIELPTSVFHWQNSGKPELEIGLLCLAKAGTHSPLSPLPILNNSTKSTEIFTPLFSFYTRQIFVGRPRICFRQLMFIIATGKKCKAT